jgi:hypothetical protein
MALDDRRPITEEDILKVIKDNPPLLDSNKIALVSG